MPSRVNRRQLVRSIDVKILTDLIVKEVLDSSSDDQDRKMDEESESSSDDDHTTTAIARCYAADSRYLSPRQ
ncbi:hypothetical protein RvY_15695 [Ramazzottius varieornatus]|nr:hypothetical protein RvY_15695 [Ramazzottius varieornatus]